MTNDIDRMSVCDVCGGPACFGFGMTLDGIRMGDVGSWRCADHHPTRKARYTREEWADARAKGKLYPDESSPEGEWQKLSNIVAGIARKAAA
jgi:hypothetical protein